MTFAFACMGAYILLLGVASFAERPVGAAFRAFQLNTLVRTGGLVVGLAAFALVDRFTLPSALPALAGLGIGVIAGSGSICYCLALDYLPVSIVVACANLYIVVTVLLGIAVLGEPLTPLKTGSLVLTLAGVLVLSYSPGRHGVQPGHKDPRSGKSFAPAIIVAAYIVLIGFATFLEKPALSGLDPTELNALQSTGMIVVAAIALAVRGERLPIGTSAAGAAGVGAMMGLGAIFYFLALQHLAVSVAAAMANAYMLVTVLLSRIFLAEIVSWTSGPG